MIILMKVWHQTPKKLTNQTRCTFLNLNFFLFVLQHNIVAPHDGTVEEVFVGAGQMVNHNDELITIKEKVSVCVGCCLVVVQSYRYCMTNINPNFFFFF